MAFILTVGSREEWKEEGGITCSNWSSFVYTQTGDHVIIRSLASC